MLREGHQTEEGHPKGQGQTQGHNLQEEGARTGVFRETYNMAALSTTSWMSPLERQPASCEDLAVSIWVDQTEM